MFLFYLYKNVGFCRGNKPRVSKAFVAFWDKVYKLKYKGDKVMKKYLLLGTSLIVASSAYAVTCEQLPECSSLGFTQTATDCAGKNMLKCPFETDKVFCGGDTGQGCDAVGDILYSDLNCYDESSLPSGKVTPIAVVFDTENRLAVALNNSSDDLKYPSISRADASFLTYYASLNTALAEFTTGKGNTVTFVALGGNYASSNYAPGYCYNLTEGNQSKGNWFLPNLKELKTMYDNKTTINISLASVEGTTINDTFYPSSTMYDPFVGAKYDSLWVLDMSDGIGYSSGNISFYVRCSIAF